MPQHQSISYLLAALLGTQLSGQSTLIAPKAAVTVGNSNNNIPFSWYPSRYQQAFAYDAFDATRPQLLRSVALRMAPPHGTGAYGGQTVILSAWMALGATDVNGMPASPGNLSTTFTANLDPATTQQVILKKAISYPKLNHYGFGLVFPFDNSLAFAWPGATGKRALVAEFRVYGNSNGNNYFTYPLDLWDGRRSSTGTYAQNSGYAGCKSVHQTLVLHQSHTSELRVGSQNHMLLGHGWADGLTAAGLIGFRAQPPVKLPGTSCVIAQDVTFLVFGRSSGLNGYTKIPLPIPPDQSLGNASFYSQMAWLERGANSLGITTSLSLMQTIAPGPDPNPQTGQVIANGSSPTVQPDTLLNGGTVRNRGYVFAFRDY
ncbi:MAG: hypothetical protein KDC87_15320 [Planctomycetes bacterium]|nr:hypothetical protein [Planctomycetota bacterium]MCB9872345.1 hypothetical protein [Planctomycetota bacterium]MCB9889817.1 hypothetical protein [Planctomycetota bacterium]